MTTIPTALLIIAGIAVCALVLALVFRTGRAEKAEREKHIKWLEERENAD